MDILPSDADYYDVAKIVFPEIIKKFEKFGPRPYRYLSQYVEDILNKWPLPNIDRLTFIRVLYVISIRPHMKDILETTRKLFQTKGFIFYYFDFVRLDSVVGMYANQPKISKYRVQVYPEVKPDIFEISPGISFADSVIFDQSIKEGFLPKETSFPNGRVKYPQIWTMDDMAKQIYQEAKKRDLLVVDTVQSSTDTIVMEHVSPLILNIPVTHNQLLMINRNRPHLYHFYNEKVYNTAGELKYENVSYSGWRGSHLMRLMYRKVFETPIYVDWSKLCPLKLLDFPSLQSVAESEFGLPIAKTKNMEYSDLCTYLTNRSDQQNEGIFNNKLLMKLKVWLPKSSNNQVPDGSYPKVEVSLRGRCMKGGPHKFYPKFIIVSKNCVQIPKKTKTN